MVQWSCEIPLEELDSFVEFVKEKLKPFHETHGCKRLELFMPLKVQKKYFRYQVSQKENRYVEQLIFNELKNFRIFFKNAINGKIYSKRVVHGKKEK